MGPRVTSEAPSLAPAILIAEWDHVLAHANAQLLKYISDMSPHPRNISSSKKKGGDRRDKTPHGLQANLCSRVGNSGWNFVPSILSSFSPSTRPSPQIPRLQEPARALNHLTREQIRSQRRGFLGSATLELQISK